MGALLRKRVYMVKPRDVKLKIPTDLLGLKPIEYNQGDTTTLSDRIAPAANELRNLLLTKRPSVTDADLATGTIDTTLIESREVPVVAKDARVVEEVVVGKTATERTETISDTVRKTNVVVDETPDEVIYVLPAAEQ